MTDDPIQAAAERLANELPLTGEPSPGVIALIFAAFREQRAEAEREWRDDKWDAVELQLNYTKQCLSDAEARVRALAAESSTHLTLTAEQWHRRWLDETNDSDKFEARCTRLEAALRQIEARDPDCDCDHTDEDCCAKHLDQINGAFCARCFAHAVLSEAARKD